MRSAISAAGLLVLATTGAIADPITRYTITGRSSAAATAQGVPLDQTPKPPAEPQDLADGDAAQTNGAVAVPAKPRVERYGLLGLSWRSH